MNTKDAIRSRLEAADVGTHETDEMAWACARGMNYPLTAYDQETFEDALRQGEPEACLTTSTSHALKYLQQQVPEGLTLSLEMKAPLVTVIATVRRAGEVIVSCQNKPIGSDALALAIVTLDIVPKARDLQAKIWEAEAALEMAGPPASWPLEQLPNLRWAHVHHEAKVIASAMPTPDKATEYANQTRCDVSAFICLRQNYRAHLPEKA